MKKLIMATEFVLLWSVSVTAQYQVENKVETPVFPWPEGKRCAVSLTFDDARFTQIDHGIPLLNRYQVKATFYVSPKRLIQRPEGWKQAIKTGHEIGNHTYSHPCTGNYAFSRANALEDYTLEKIAQEIKQANDFVYDTLGVRPKSFAYPCGQTFVGRGRDLKSYIPLIAEHFVSGRGWLGESSNDPWFCDMAQLLGMECDGKSFEELKVLVDKAAAGGRWLVLAGHEITDTGRQTTSLASLEEFCKYAQNSDNGIWIDTVGNIAEYILTTRLSKETR